MLPDGCADAYLTVNGGMSLVSYLKWVFDHGGFPKSTSNSEQWKVVYQLTRGERFSRLLEAI